MTPRGQMIIVFFRMTHLLLTYMSKSAETEFVLFRK